MLGAMPYFERWRRFVSTYIVHYLCQLTLSSQVSRITALQKMFMPPNYSVCSQVDCVQLHRRNVSWMYECWSLPSRSCVIGLRSYRTLFLSSTMPVPHLHLRSQYGKHSLRFAPSGVSRCSLVDSQTGNFQFREGRSWW